MSVPVARDRARGGRAPEEARAQREDARLPAGQGADEDRRAAYGAQVRIEVIGDAVQKAFADAVKEANLQGRRLPADRTEEGRGADAGALEFSATFEVYPEVKLGDVAGASIERPLLDVDDAAVDKTIEILRKQRATYARGRARARRTATALTVDFDGTIDGELRGRQGRGLRLRAGRGAHAARSSRPRARGMKRGRVEDLRAHVSRRTTTARTWPGRPPSFALTVKKVEEPQAAGARRRIRASARRRRRRPRRRCAPRSAERRARGEEARRGRAQAAGAAGAARRHAARAAEGAGARWRRSGLVQQRRAPTCRRAA